MRCLWWAVLVLRGAGWCFVVRPGGQVPIRPPSAA